MTNNVSYFKRILSDERKQLLSHCRKWQKVLTACAEDETFPEHAKGEIRTTIGLTELLLDQKLKQFGGLISDCEKKAGEIKVTCEDLQGFWDMVYCEVEKLNKSFNKLEIMEENDWEDKEEAPVPTKKQKTVKPKTIKPQAKSSSSAKAHVLAARKRLAEAKAGAEEVKDPEIPAVEEKENSGKVISTNPADSTTNEKAVSVPVTKKADAEGKKKSRAIDAVSAKTVSSSKVSARTKKAKEFIPLACITRSAKRALIEQNRNVK